MNRLTNKDINWYEDFVFSLRNRLITKDEIDNSIYQRLKAFEDIEDEMGWSLLYVIRVIKYKQIIIKYKHEFVSDITLEECKIIGLDYDGNDFILWYYDECDGSDYVFIKDYGKTWALTREELEHDKNNE